MVKLACVIPWIIRGLFVAVLASVIVVRAEQASFTASLPAEDKAMCGLTRLTAAQLASLDAQVQHEIATARQGNTVAFSTTFTHRRTPVQRREAGLDHLMTPELAQLDRLVAAALTNRPPPASPQASTPTTTSAPEIYVETIKPKWEVHGGASLTYVSGSGGAHGYGASMFTSATDPSGKFTIAVGLSQFNGKGFRRYPYYYGYPYSPYYYPDEFDYDRGW